MKSLASGLKAEGKIIGFVPTMGFLHSGHLSLVREAVNKSDITVVSVFVNPAQFGPKEDFKEYPRDINRDSRLLKAEGVDYLFVPREEEMYPEGYSTYVEVQKLQDRLCGRSRPGHFRGVCTVVLKLFNIVQPDLAYFGQKDAQQALILRRMAKDLDLDTRIEALPIVREPDGLAVSSRNTLLDPEQRKAALVLSSSLNAASTLVEEGEREAAKIIQRIKEEIQIQPLARIDYVEIVDIDSLLPVKRLEKKTLIGLAVFVGRVRLIDNVVIEVEER